MKTMAQKKLFKEIYILQSNIKEIKNIAIKKSYIQIINVVVKAVPHTSRRSKPNAWTKQVQFHSRNMFSLHLLGVQLEKETKNTFY